MIIVYVAIYVLVIMLSIPWYVLVNIVYRVYSWASIGNILGGLK